MRWRDRACSRLGSRLGASVVLAEMKVPPGRGLFPCAEATPAGRPAATAGRLTAAAVETRKFLRLTLGFAIAFSLVRRGKRRELPRSLPYAICLVNFAPCYTPR